MKSDLKNERGMNKIKKERELNFMKNSIQNSFK